MQSASKPSNETARLEALYKHQLLDTVSEEVYNDITKLASEICGTPTSILNLIDADRQWSKARFGIDVREAPREISFCAHAILQPHSVLMVPDARYDERFHNNPMTKSNPPIIFYAGVPVLDKDGYALGALCVVDERPRTLSEEKLQSLKALAKLVQVHFELRLANICLSELSDRLMLGVPLVDTILNEIEMLKETVPRSEQYEQLEMLKDTANALRTIFKDPELS